MSYLIVILLALIFMIFAVKIIFPEVFELIKEKMNGSGKGNAQSQKEESESNEMIQKAEKILYLNIRLFSVTNNSSLLELTKDISTRMIDVMDLLVSKNHHSAIFDAIIDRYFVNTLTAYFDLLKSSNITNTDISEKEAELVEQLNNLNEKLIKIPNQLENSLIDDLDKAFLVMEEMLKDVK